MLESVIVEEDCTLLPRIEALYEQAFPENERQPFSRMLGDDTGHCRVFAFLEGGKFYGFATVLYCGDIAHITFLAVEPRLQGGGFGSKMVTLLHEKTPGMRFIVDIEQPGEQYADNSLRQSRKRFYRRLGYRETEVKYRWQDEDYEILCCGGSLTRDDFHNFWRTLREETKDSKVQPF